MIEEIKKILRTEMITIGRDEYTAKTGQMWEFDVERLGNLILALFPKGDKDGLLTDEEMGKVGFDMGSPFGLADRKTVCVAIAKAQQALTIRLEHYKAQAQSDRAGWAEEELNRLRKTTEDNMTPEEAKYLLDEFFQIKFKGDEYFCELEKQIIAKLKKRAG